MKITVLTLFPEMFEALQSSIIGRAISAGTISLSIRNIRDYSADKHFKCDDVPYGGGAGMVMTPQPIISAIEAVDPGRQARRIYLSPRGRVLNHDLAKQLAGETELILLCGHYEGIDQRALEIAGCDEISIGDYVLTGGELPAMVLIDCLSRHIKGVLGSEESAGDESFSDGLLEYPHYTRPQSFKGLEVPPVLLSGHHAKIKEWRNQKSLEITRKLRPDLLKNTDLTEGAYNLEGGGLTDNPVLPLKSKGLNSKPEN